MFPTFHHLCSHLDVSSLLLCCCYLHWSASCLVYLSANLHTFFKWFILPHHTACFQYAECCLGWCIDTHYLHFPCVVLAPHLSCFASLISWFLRKYSFYGIKVSSLKFSSITVCVLSYSIPFSYGRTWSMVVLLIFSYCCDLFYQCNIIKQGTDVLVTFVGSQ